MPKLAANLTMMFSEVPFLDRFERAAGAGFKAVEFQFPYDHSPNDIAARLKDNNLQLVLFNMPPGDWDSGDRGMASIPGREAEFMTAVDNSLQYAKAMGCHQIHMMAGIPPVGVSDALASDTYLRNLEIAAATCRSEGVNVLIEPLNQTDMPGYFLNRQQQAIDLIASVEEANVGLQMDLYHCLMTEGNPARLLRDNFSHISHIQIAGVPGRHEPDVGEMKYTDLIALIDELGYGGFIGCEYFPAGETTAGLGWASSYLAV